MTKKTLEEYKIQETARTVFLEGAAGVEIGGEFTYEAAQSEYSHA